MFNLKLIITLCLLWTGSAESAGDPDVTLSASSNSPIPSLPTKPVSSSTQHSSAGAPATVRPLVLPAAASHVPLTPITVDAGDFAKVDVQPEHGPIKIEAPLTRLHINRQTWDMNLRAGPVAVTLDTAKGGKPFGLLVDIPKIFNMRIGHPARGGQGINVDIPILRELSQFLRNIQQQQAEEPKLPCVPVHKRPESAVASDIDNVDNGNASAPIDNADQPLLVEPSTSGPLSLETTPVANEINAI